MTQPTTRPPTRPTAAATAAPTGAATASDDELVERIRGGDRSAFELIMRRHNQRLYRLARSVVRAPADAAEAVQDGYVQAYEKLASYRGPASFAAWLGRIVLNKAMDRMRDRGRVISLEAALASERGDDVPKIPPERLASQLGNPEQLAASSDIRRLIEQAVDALPDDFRTVFMLRAVEGLEVDEVARQLDVPSATVRTRYHRARQRLRDHLGDRLELTLPTAFPFAGARCDAIVAGVLERIAALPASLSSHPNTEGD
jgi:RNA polymerase sigma-70 factor, ECF subfamily